MQKENKFFFSFPNESTFGVAKPMVSRCNIIDATYTDFAGNTFIYEGNGCFQHTRNIHYTGFNIHATYTQHTREIHMRVIVPNMGIKSSQRGNKKFPTWE